MSDSLSPAKGEHSLKEAREFTEHRVGWDAQPSGGSVPIYEPLDPSYWRWYCTCGAVGGKSGTASACRLDHTRHIERHADNVRWLPTNQPTNEGEG